MGNAVDPSSILEQIRRARLYNPNFGAAPVSQNQTPEITSNQSPITIPGNIQEAQVQAPQSPKDKALADYRQVLQQGAPNQSDYHPSVGRRIAAVLLGSLAGMHDVKSGAEVGHGIAYGPYDQKLTEYQKRLAEKKALYETESGAEKESSLEKEQGARTSTEEAKREAEKARGLTEEGKARALVPGTPEFEGEQKKLQIQHPNTPKLPVPYELKLKNGETVVGYEGQNGQFKDAEGNIYGTDSIENARKVGTSEPKGTTVKPPREGEAGYIDQWMKEHGGREPSTAERTQIHKAYESAGKDTSDQDLRKEIQMGTARQNANRNYQTQFNQASSHLDKLDQVKLLITTGTPESIAVAVPNVLTALISGQGTGVRITQAEINQILHARGFGQSIEAFTNKISGKGALDKKTKQDIVSMVDDVSKKVQQKQKQLADTMDEIDNAKTPEEISKAHIKYRKLSTGGSSQGGTNELPGGITLDDINKELARRKGAQQ
jgi:hypothetical protein